MFNKMHKDFLRYRLRSIERIIDGTEYEARQDIVDAMHSFASDPEWRKSLPAEWFTMIGYIETMENAEPTVEDKCMLTELVESLEEQLL